ncbi:MAG: glyoxalase superfamily protein [Pseudomonadota bacterium]
MRNISLHAIPILRIGRVDVARQFYREFLGFEIDWEHYYEPGAPIYMQVSRAGCVLQLSENERFNAGQIIYVDTQGIDTLHAELAGRDGPWSPPDISTSPWQTRQMEIADPFGNLLRFHEEVA